MEMEMKLAAKKTASGDLLASVLPSSDMRPQIRHGDIYIGPELSRWILANCFYSGQEKRMKSGGISVLRHVVRLRRGRWIPGSQIVFCRLPGGRLVLVNGYHRVSAIIKYGEPAKFNVQLIDTADDAAVDSIYSLFDRAKDSRSRTLEQHANALHFNERLGVSKTIARAIGSAVLLIQNGYGPIKPSDREKLVEFDGVEDVLDLAMTWKKEAQAVDEIFKEARGALKRKLVVGAVLAIVLTTIKFQPERAKGFWLSVAKNDGLRKGTAEHTLVNWLLSYRMEANSDDGFIAVALAWNAFYYKRSLSTLRVGSAVGLRIAGTPIKREG